MANKKIYTIYRNIGLEQEDLLMAISASIDLMFSKDKGYSTSTIIKMFLEIGWRLEDEHGKISFTPLGDDDGFDWQGEMLTKDELFSIVSLKEQILEKICLIFYWKDSDIGITLISNFPEYIMISLDINRKKLHEEKKDNGWHSVTDFNWYIEQTIVKLREANYYVEGFQCFEYI